MRIIARNGVTDRAGTDIIPRGAVILLRCDYAVMCCSRPLSRICEDGRPPRRSATSPYLRTACPGSWATRPATTPSITSYPAPRNRFRLSRSSKRFISIRRLIADRTEIVETAAFGVENGEAFASTIAKIRSRYFRIQNQMHHLMSPCSSRREMLFLIIHGKE